MNYNYNELLIQKTKKNYRKKLHKATTLQKLPKTKKIQKTKILLQ